MTVTVERLVVVTQHAIDRMSTRHLDHWQARRNEDEGIASYLQRMADEAWEVFPETGGLDNMTVRYSGIRFVFRADSVRPILVTVK